MSAVPISLQCGVDWWMQFTYTDGSGNPIAVTSPKMEIRLRGAGGAVGEVLYSSETDPATITLTSQGVGIVKAAIAGSITKNLPLGQGGVWDCYATDPNGEVVQLGEGTFTATPNQTAL